MSLFQVDMKFFYFVSTIIYSCIFIILPVLLIVKRKKVSGIKLMILGVFLVASSAVFFSEPAFKIYFSLLNFLTLLFGFSLVVVGFYLEK